MPDDRLEAFAREAPHQFLPPDFDVLVTTARRRRRVTYVGAV